MFRTPLPCAGRAMLEHCSTEDLLGIFESCVRTNTKKIAYNEFPAAWEILFTDLYLSAEELVSEFRAGTHRLDREQELMLHEFIRMDCRTGGAFIINVIKTGGKIDRAALFMLADPGDLARLAFHGTTALHMLTEACDKGLRPALIERAGKKLLSEVFDNKDLPVLFLILGLGDLSMNDLNAIGNVFTRDELGRVRSRKGTGRSALEAFDAVSAALRSHASLERNAFEVARAVRDTKPEGTIRVQMVPAGGAGGSSGAGREPAKNAESGDERAGSTSETCGEPGSDTPDDTGRALQRKPGTG